MKLSPANIRGSSYIWVADFWGKTSKLANNGNAART